MKSRSFGLCLLAAAGFAAVCAAPAFADFVGQVPVGTLTYGSVANGNNTGHTDRNDGFTSGTHIFDIWRGGDDVFLLNWAGGDLFISLFYNNQLCDVDLFLYTPSNLDDSSDYGISNNSPDTVLLLGAAAGTYYIVVDSETGREGAYQLAVIPTPGAGLMLAASGAALARRRRR